MCRLQNQTVTKINKLIEGGELVYCGLEPPIELSLEGSMQHKYWRCLGILPYETNSIMLAVPEKMWCYQAVLVGSTGFELDDLGAPASGGVHTWHQVCAEMLLLCVLQAWRRFQSSIPNTLLSTSSAGPLSLPSKRPSQVAAYWPSCSRS